MDTLMRYYTNAPNAYDYSYVETIESGLREGGGRSVWQPWRLISVSDAERFARYQLPRYNSGGYAALRADSKEAQCLELSPQGFIAKLNDGAWCGDWQVVGSSVWCILAPVWNADKPNPGWVADYDADPVSVHDTEAEALTALGGWWVTHRRAKSGLRKMRRRGSR